MQALKATGSSSTVVMSCSPCPRPCSCRQPPAREEQAPQVKGFGKGVEGGGGGEKGGVAAPNTPET